MRQIAQLPADFLTCKECGQSFSHQQWLTKHLHRDHGLNLQSYLIKHYLSGEEPKCQCGHCSESVPLYIKDGYMIASEYFHGHNFRDPETKAKAVSKEALAKQKASREQTLLNKYGVKNAFELCKGKGTEASHSDEANQKRQQTLLDRYGVTQNFQRPEVIASHCTEEANQKRTEAAQKTNLNKYGVITPLMLPESHEKARSAKALLKKRKTNVERYGYEYPYLNPESRDKFHKISKAEQEIIDFLQTYNIKVEKSKRKYLQNHEIDIYLPNYSVGIEFDGLYWHSEELGKDMDYHLSKTRLAEENGIHLIHIFEDEWLRKKSIVQDRILSLLHSPAQVIYARKCMILPISAQEAKTFVNNSHLQGSCKSNVQYGAFYNDELVGVCTFSKPRLGVKSKSESGYELARYCIRSGYRIQGLLSRFLHKFHVDYPDIESVYSYADRRYVSKLSNIYSKSGFVFESESLPNYWYFKSGHSERIHRSQFMKHKLVKEGWGTKDQTEHEIMQANGYQRIWDCGTLKYRYIF